VSEEDRPNQRELLPGPVMGGRKYGLRGIRWMLAAFGVMLVLAAGVALIVSINEYVTVFGVIIPVDEVELRSTDATVVTEVVVEVGDRLEPGDVVARLYDYEARKQLARQEDALAGARGRLAIARANLTRTRLVPLPDKLWFADLDVEESRLVLEAKRNQLGRIEELHEEGHTSDWELEAARTAMETARIGLEKVRKKKAIASAEYARAIIQAAEAQVQLAEAEVAGLEREIVRCRQDLDRTVLRAPCAGVVTRVEKRDGEPVARGELVASIGRSEAAELRAYVNQAQMFKVHRGQRVQIRSAMYPYRKYGQCYGVVSKTNYWATKEGQGTYYEIRVEITEIPSTLTLKFGSSATARVFVGRNRIINILTE